jgi:PncC family amidohydrolase
LATAESCTGGGVAAAVTAVPGSSEYFHGSVVTYSNEWKQRLLGVDPGTLADFGAVSAETAEEMLQGLRRNYGVEAGIAVTGIAGPGGGSAEKPVGLVFVGTQVEGKTNVRRCEFPGDRDTVRRRTVATALGQLRLDLIEHGCEV